MIEELFYITGTLSVTLLGLTLARHETTGNLKSEIKALERENSDLRQKLKKEAEDSNDLFNRLRAHYDERDSEQKDKNKKQNWSRDEWDKGFLALLTEWDEKPKGSAMQAEYRKIAEEMDKRSIGSR